MTNDLKALKSGAWYTVANFLTRSVGILTTPIFTRLLTKSDFGAYSNYTSWLAIATIIVTLYLDSTFIRARFEFKDKFDEYIFSLLSLSTFSAIMWLGIVNAYSFFFVDLLKMDITYINCMLLYLIFLPAVNMYQTKERYYYNYKKTVLISLLLTIGTAAISVLLVILMNNKLTGRIYGSVSLTVIIGLVLYIVIAKKGKRIKIDYWKYAIPICIPFIPHLLSLTFLNSLDRIMITDICGEEENALYSLAYNCGAIATILVTSMNTAFSPWLGEKLYNEKYEEIRKVSKIYISLFMFLLIGVMLITPEILLILGGNQYLDAKYVMPPITCGVAFQFLYSLFVNVEQFNKKTVGMAIASISAALLNFILNYLFIPRYGYIAAAYTTLAGYFWLLVIHMFLVKKMCYQKVYDYKFIALVVIIILVITIGINFLFSYSLIRYAVFVLYLISFLFITKKYGKIIIKKYKAMKERK